MNRVREVYDRVLEIIAVILIVAVTTVVALGFGFRWAGRSLVWYDEIASISLAWLTYYAAALAALRGSHLGFSGFVNSLPAKARVAAVLFSSGVTIFLFVLMAYVGMKLLPVIAGITLVSLPEVSQGIVMSAIPIASTLVVIAELLRLPALLVEARRGPLVDAELKDALEHAGITPAKERRG